MFPFLHRECIKLQKGRLRNETPLNFILKERFLVFKNFDQSQGLQTIAKKSLQIHIFLEENFAVI